MKRNDILRLLGLGALLFALFISYRLIFWEEVSKNYGHTLFNALGDAVFCVACGLLLYRLQLINVLRKWFLAIAVVVMLVFALGLYKFHYLIYVAFGKLTPDFIGFFNAFCFQLLDSGTILISGALAVIIQRQQKDRRKIDKAMAVLELENQRVELKYLKSQMDPHFVFNGLNMIYHQMPEENKAARESLLQFSGILRYHLQYASNDLVSLEQEIGYLKSYVQFQKKRCADFIEIEEDMEWNHKEGEIEPLILLPLVENAVKFCHMHNGKKGKVKMRFRADEKGLKFQIENTYVPEKIRKNRGQGIGLANVRRRLSIRYPGRHEFTVNDAPESHLFTCNLQLWS